MNKNKEESRSKAYNLKDFLLACDRNRESILIDEKAIEDAINTPLKLYGKKDILDFISQYSEKDFVYINTLPFRKGLNGSNPLVDSYELYLKHWDLYIAFMLTEKKKWYIKSFHSDNKVGTVSIGDIAKIMLGKNYEKNRLSSLRNKKQLGKKGKKDKN